MAGSVESPLTSTARLYRSAHVVLVLMSSVRYNGVRDKVVKPSSHESVCPTTSLLASVLPRLILTGFAIPLVYSHSVESLSPLGIAAFTGLIWMVKSEPGSAKDINGVGVIGVPRIAVGAIFAGVIGFDVTVVGVPSLIVGKAAFDCIFLTALKAATHCDNALRAPGSGSTQVSMQTLWVFPE